MDRYTRRISRQEADEGFMLVEKRALPFFPAEGQEFILDGARRKVESYPCICRGPELPHQHWFVRLPRLVKGQQIAIVKAGERTFRSEQNAAKKPK